MYQSTTILGRLGKDPEVNGIACRFTVAVTSKYKEKEKTEWFNCVSFNKQGEIIAKYFKKGALIMLSGTMETSTYEKDGVEKRSTSLIVREFSFVESKGQSQHGNQEQSKQHDYSIATNAKFSNDEIPF